MTKKRLLHADSSRVWTIVRGARPDRFASYRGLGQLGNISRSNGSVSPVMERDLGSYEDRRIVGTQQEPEGLASTSIMFRAQRDASEVLRDFRRCEVDVQLHFGECGSPDDFEAWERIIAVRLARPDTYSLAGASALDGDAIGTEIINLAGVDLYEILPVATREITSTVVSSVFLAVGDFQRCADCPPEHVLVAIGSTATPDQTAWIASYDGGKTWPISETISNTGNPVAVIVHHGYVVEAWPTDDGHRYMLIDTDDTRVLNDSYENGAPLAFYSNHETGRLHVAGEAGWLYYMTMPFDTPTTAHAAVALNDDLNAIDGYGANLVVAVGDSNSVMASRNDGRTYRLIVGPSGGANLTAVECVSESVWFVGDDAGALFYTVDAGENWEELIYGGDGTTGIVGISFFDSMVGFLAADRVYRTVDGGATWLAISGADSFRSLAVLDQNHAVAGLLSGFVIRLFSD